MREHAGRYEAVIVNGLWQYHGLAVWRALRGTSTPYFVFTHGMLDPWFKREYPLKHLKKWLYWPWAEYRVLRDARAVLFTCDEERALARQSFSLYRANEVVVGYGALGPSGDIAAQREAFLSRFLELRGKRLLLFLGRVHPKKGCDLLIRAFAALAHSDPSLHLVMAGPDSSNWQPELNRSLVAARLERRVTWTGMLTGDVKWGALLASEAFVLPSHQENFGIAVVEALACGVPVLISDKVNIWREIVKDDAGLVASDTLEGTVEVMRNWITAAPARRAQLARNALGCFRRRFHLDSVARSLTSVLDGSALSDRQGFAA
jgi:glycosyltransferase involved in cell wall biosynthesis